MIYELNASGRANFSLDDLAETVTKTVAALKPVRSEFDVIAVAGMSGVIVGAPAALRLRKPLVVIRKATDDSHHGKNQIINRDRLIGKRAMFLDDFVSNGDTQTRVTERVDVCGGRVVGTYLYRDDDLELSS